LAVRPGQRYRSGGGTLPVVLALLLVAGNALGNGAGAARNDGARH